jgi:hypothetical protein
MDYFKEIATMINPIENARLIAEINQQYKGLRLFTITLGQREYQTTNSKAAFEFTQAFGKHDGFNMKSVPHSGAEIPTVINVN